MAAQVQAVEELRKEGKVKEGDIGYLFVVGEEVDHIGMVVSCDFCSLLRSVPIAPIAPFFAVLLEEYSAQGWMNGY